TAPRLEPPRSCSQQIFKLPTEQRPIPEPPAHIRPAIERHPRGDPTRPDAAVALRLWNRKKRRAIASRNCRHLHPVTAHISASSERHVVPKVLRLLRLLRPLAAEHHELVRHDLRGVAIIAVAVLPFPRPQLPL